MQRAAQNMRWALDGADSILQKRSQRQWLEKPNRPRELTVEKVGQSSDDRWRRSG